MATLTMTEKEFNNSTFFNECLYIGMVWENDTCYAKYERQSEINTYTILVN
jgi:hypothetical protein